jgi:hypothetical protein
MSELPSTKAFEAGYELANNLITAGVSIVKASRVNEGGKIVVSFFTGMKIAINERRGATPRIRVTESEELK